MKLNESYNIINNKEDFLRFIDNLLIDIKENEAEWENITLPDFLVAIKAYIEDKELQLDDWKKLAELFMAARVYE